jgi:hypothetical protein
VAGEGDVSGGRISPARAALVRALAAAVLLTCLVGLASPSPAGAQATLRGVLEVEVRDDFDRGESTTTYRLQSGGETTPILPTTPPAADPGDAVAVTGTMREGKIVGSVAPDTSTVLPGPIFAGARRVAVFLVKFPGDPALPWSPSETREKVFTSTSSTDAYFREESHGAIALEGKANPEEGDVFGWFTLDASGSGCSPHAWGDEALDLASESGVSLGGYHHFVFVFTPRPGCLWNGMATLGGNFGTAYIDGNLGVKTIAHELGHNFGLGHAGSWTCTKGGSRVQMSDSCAVHEYGDVFDTMGNVSTRHNNGWNLEKLGLLGPAHVVTATEDGTYPLRAAFSLTPTPTILRVPRAKDAAGNVISWYYLEVRQRGGVFEDVDDATMTGVSIRATAGGSSPETLLVDASPSTSTFADAPLQVGGTFSDGIVRIGTLSAGGGAASVSVDFLALNDSVPPTAPAGLTATQSASGVHLQWSPSTDDAIVSRYVVFRDGSEIGTAPTPAFTDTGAAPGLHAYVVYAEDLAGNRSPASEPKLVTVVDISPPHDPPPPPPPPPPPAPDPPAPGAPTPPAPGGEEQPLDKPILRWQRRPGGTLAFHLDARGSPDVVRVSLWLGQRLLRAKAGRSLRFAWKPRKARCAGAYRFVARAEASGGRQAVSVVRLRAGDVGGGSGECRRRQRAERAR